MLRDHDQMTSSPEPKKRRFFLEDPEVESNNNPNGLKSYDEPPAWEALRPLVLPDTNDSTLAELYQKSNGNVEVAANLFWENQMPSPVAESNVPNIKDHSSFSNAGKPTTSRSGCYIGDIITVGKNATFTVCDIET
jgi:hypothetical protein